MCAAGLSGGGGSIEGMDCAPAEAAELSRAGSGGEGVGHASAIVRHAEPAAPLKLGTGGAALPAGSAWLRGHGAPTSLRNPARRSLILLLPP